MADKSTVSQNLRNILEYIGDDPDREGLQETPERIIRSWEKLYGGYKRNPEDVLTTKFNEGACNEMVILQDIEFYSTCEHHMLPFFGQVHIGYIPDEQVLGISKLARLVEVYSRRLQIQERMTTQIADAIMEYAEAKGAIVITKGQHFCMTSRGVEKQESKMVTNAIRGEFRKHKVKQEFLDTIQL